MMNITKRRYRLNGITPILGSQPNDEHIRAQFIASKAPTPIQGARENGLLPDTGMDRGLTVFLQDRESSQIYLMDYMLVGYFKGAVKALAAQNGIKQPESKVGTYVFVSPREIPMMRNGQPILIDDGILERPLRAQTMQGPRNTLTASERIDEPWSVEICVSLLENAGTGKSAPITWDALEEALDYGALKGLGQWRNGGYGRFTWERLEDEQ